MTSLNSKAEKNFPLQKIFDDLLLITDSNMSSEEIRLEVKRVLATPADPIAALRSVLSILEKNPSANNASLDAECLAAVISKLNLAEDKTNKSVPATPSGPITAPQQAAPSAATDPVESSPSLSHATLDTLNQQNSLFQQNSLLLHNL